MNKKKRIIRDVKRSAEAKSEGNAQAHNKVMKQAGMHRCRYCEPWDFDNKVARKSKRGAKKPRHKDKR